MSAVLVGDIEGRHDACGGGADLFDLLFGVGGAMKYWEIDTIDGPVSLRHVKNLLTSHPEIPGAYLTHWYHGDHVGTDFIPREEILKTSRRKLESGATAQWAYARGRF